MAFEKPKKEILTEELIRLDIHNGLFMQDRLSIYVGLTIVLLFASLIFAILIPYILLLPIVPIICAVLSDIHFKKKAKALTNSEIVVLTDTLLYEKQNEVRREASLI